MSGGGGELSGDFDASRAIFDEVVSFLGGDDAAVLSHGELEDEIGERGRTLLCSLLQDHLDGRARRERRLEAVTDCDGGLRPSVEAGAARGLTTVFGPVEVQRLAYRHKGLSNLYPADAVLNLPTERHSHGLRQLAAIEATRGSYQDTQEAICRATGQLVGKRQIEELVRRAAVDVEDFYTRIEREPVEDADVVVLSADGKGIVMRPDSLRPATAAKAASTSTKLQTRLSKGEKRNRKRLAEVGAVYDITPVARTATDVLAANQPQPAPVPKAVNKWLTASVVDDAAEVITTVFDEAQRRDPNHQRTWIALVDGNNHQIQRIRAEAATRNITITVVIDFIHVLEYLWSAAWCFFDEADPAAETWVHDRALAVLNGNADAVAAGLRRRASTANLTTTKRAKADEAARYLHNKAPYLDYPTALQAGWPIATGVIEGACRHLVKDRMDITGARWGLDGAEAVLKLRALHANGDFDTYWTFHLNQEQRRVHNNRYLNGTIPRAA